VKPPLPEPVARSSRAKGETKGLRASALHL
jgi:hypothetical protein